MLFELVGLLIVLGISAHISDQTKKFTRIVVSLLFIQSLSICFERWTQNFEKLSLARPLLSALIYSIYPLLLLFAMKLMRPEQRSWKRNLLLLIPEIVCVPLFFTSQWTHLVCWYTEDNHYQSGPLYMLPYILFGIYSVYFLIQNLLFFKKYTRRERILFIYIISVPLIGVIIHKVIETMDNYGALFTAGLILYFLSLYIHMAKIDPLTELFNRQSYYQGLKQMGKNISAVISADMNELKFINDHQGHQAGDLALKTIAGILMDHCGVGGIVYRVGGDEFIILYTNTGEEKVAKAVEKMREKIGETAYSCAFGYAIAKEGRPIDDVLSEADEKMYLDKANIKALKRAHGEALHDR